jgi:hypothetical protein
MGRLPLDAGFRESGDPQQPRCLDALLRARLHFQRSRKACRKLPYRLILLARGNNVRLPRDLPALGFLRFLFPDFRTTITVV